MVLILVLVLIQDTVIVMSGFIGPESDTTTRVEADLTSVNVTRAVRKRGIHSISIIVCDMAVVDNHISSSRC